MRNKKNVYIPAIEFDWLTPLYDPLIRLTMRETQFKQQLIKQAHVKSGYRILDIGCGTGTLLLLVKKISPETSNIGLDGDSRILMIAKSKSKKQGNVINFIQALSFDIPLANTSMDCILSSLMLHHLTRTEKLETLKEVFRVLRPGGKFHVADWGKPHNRLMNWLSLLVLLGDRLNRTKDNVQGLLPELFRSVGFDMIHEETRFSTLFGTLSLFSARKPKEVY